jgi:hypothetical protein
VTLVAPLDTFIAELVAQRPSTAVWLFPGHTPGQPLTPKSLGRRLIRIGVTRSARVGALHDLIREVPGPVLAPLIGYNPNFIADRAATLAVPGPTIPHCVREREARDYEALPTRGFRLVLGDDHSSDEQTIACAPAASRRRLP